MNLTDAINSRRSIRSYKPDTEISREAVLDIISAAQLAPSWKNSQTGRYYAVCSPDMLKKVKSECLPEFNQRNSADAPVLIVTAFEKNIAGFDTEQKPVNELANGWGAYDLGLQNQLLILKAREYNLDTLIMGIRNQDVLRSLLSIPESQQIAAVIALGYRNVEPKKPERKPIDEILKFY